MTDPLRPDEITPIKNASIPDKVVEVFNELIVKHYTGGRATVKIGEAHKALEKIYSKAEISENHYLDVEPLFREYGWNVTYDGPAYNETYEGYYEFSKK